MGSTGVAPEGQGKSCSAGSRLESRSDVAGEYTPNLQDTNEADKLARFAKSVPGFMYCAKDFHDGHSEITYASQGFEDIYGIPFHDGGLNFRRLIKALHPDDRVHVVEAVERARCQNGPFSVEHRIIHPRKGIVWVEVCANSERQADGTCLWHGFVRDISERKKTEAALHESEQRYRDVFDHTSDHIVIYDVVAETRFRCADINRAAARAFGISREAVTGKFVEEFVPSTIVETVVTRLQQCCVAKVGRQYDDTVLLPIGERSLRIILIPVPSDDGSVARIISIATDVTEEVKNRQIQHEKERYFETLVADSPDPIICFDRDCRRVYVNRALEETVLLPPADLLGKTLIEASAFDAKTANALHECVKRVIETGLPDETDAACERPGGALRAFSVRILPEHEADGRVIGALMISRDITKRVAAERALQRREQEFRSLVENSPDGIVRYDRDARRIYMNPSFGRMLESANVQSSYWPGDNKALVDPQKFVAAILEVVASASHRTLQTGWRDADGSLRFHDVRLEPEFAPDGSVASVLAIGHEITEFVEAQRELRRRERKFRTLVENSPDFIARYDRFGRRVYMNPISRRVLRHGGVETSPMPNENSAVANADGYLAIIESVIASGTGKEQEVEWHGRHGTARIAHIRFVPEFDEQEAVTSVLAIGRDITEIVLARKKIEAAASCDSLTGLPNRRDLNLRLAEYVKTGRL
jgi:PAS domain S-box-containing protein